MPRIFLIIFCTTTLGGCAGPALQQQRQEARAAYQADVADCDRLHPDKYRKPATARVRCLSNAKIRFAEGEKDPNTDLVVAMATQMVVTAERFDAGRLTEAQFDAEKAATFSDYRMRVLQRRNSAITAEDAADQGAASWAAFMPRSTTCISVGNSLTCY